MIQLLKTVLRNEARMINLAALACVPGHTGLLPLLLLVIAKSLVLQVRTRAAGSSALSMDLDQALKASGGAVCLLL